MQDRAAAQDAALYNPAPVCKPNHHLDGNVAGDESRQRLPMSKFHGFPDFMRIEYELWWHDSMSWCRSMAAISLHEGSTTALLRPYCSADKQVRAGA